MADFLKQEDLSRLPRWAKAYFAARCARRAIQMLDASLLPAEFALVLDTLAQVEQAAEHAAVIASAGDMSPARHFADGLGPWPQRKTPVWYAALAVDDAFGIASSTGSTGRGSDDAGSYQTKKLSYAISGALAVARQGRQAEAIQGAISSDLLDLLSSREAGNGTNEVPFSEDFLALRTSFDPDSEVSGSSIRELRSAITDELVARLAESPAMLFQLTPRGFEELIARVFEAYGFSVELTAATRDGGRDIIAVAHEPARVRYLIECKRYARENKVGLEIVQRLHGVVQGEDATMGLLATTSTFTEPAQRFFARPNVKYRLDGRDFEDIRLWLMQYERIRMARQLLGSDFSVTASGLIIPGNTLASSPNPSAAPDDWRRR